jgi:hypothetical protein
MTGWRAPSRPGRTVIVLGVAATLAIGAGPAAEPRRAALTEALAHGIAALLSPVGPVSRLRRGLEPDPWTRLMALGDELRADRGPAPAGGGGGPPAYLLAFHHAQDSGDPVRMLAAAERLAAAGEHELAHHARAVALGLPAAPAPRRASR